MTALWLFVILCVIFLAMWRNHADRAHMMAVHRAAMEKAERQLRERVNQAYEEHRAVTNAAKAMVDDKTMYSFTGEVPKRWDEVARNSRQDALMAAVRRVTGRDPRFLDLGPKDFLKALEPMPVPYPSATPSREAYHEETV